ncbi:UDP-glucose 4-epimerase GalE [Bdellovibrio sp. HCB185ZH]|uniref:UDP-glucose 4-epimerase GalE n=1 Tax=Bdellovibrio sp. HCB185ZH TaxID=3394235 RepID=UPI0039A6FA79
MKILVTGGAGYIGSHTANRLLKNGFEVVVFDNLTTGFREAVPKGAKFIQGDVRSEEHLTQVLRDEKISAVIHFAAKLNVKESTFKPLDYYENNTAGVLAMAKAMQTVGVKHIVFSSTAALFGDKVQDRGIVEDDPKSPLNPYGNSKLMSEYILSDAASTGALTYCALRYFNVAGASDDGENGQRTADAFHLIHLGVQAAIGKRKQLQLFGNDYPTPDGTCIRDYIHVEDLADIHLLALKHLLAGGESDYFNCGYGFGYSVKEVIKMIKTVSGADFPVIESERRPGDAASLVADSAKLKSKLGWKPQRADLNLICKSAYQWEKRISNVK